MSYTPTVWATGDVVTAEKLNKLEQGVAAAGGGSGGGGNVLVVNVTATSTSDGDTVTFDKTFAELKAAYESNAVMLCKVKIEDNVNAVYGNGIAFLTYRPAAQFPFPSPETFMFDVSFLDIGSVVYGVYATCEINAEETVAVIRTVELTAAN